MVFHINGHFRKSWAEEAGQSFVTEFKDGSVSWLCNPSNLEDRNSLAKLLFQDDCKDTNLSTSKQYWLKHPVAQRVTDFAASGSNDS